jgi:hypothetical protein
MELKNAIIRPSKVRKVLNNNVLKVSAPGLFSETDNPDLLPPVYPFVELSKNTYSTIDEGEEVWVINCVDNPSELFWIRKPDYEIGMEDKVNGTQVEILTRRESGMSWAELFFSDGTGWVMNNDGSKIVIDSKGNITLQKEGKHRTIEINDEGISLGSAGVSSEPAVLGDQLATYINTLHAMLEALSSAAKTTQYTYPMHLVIELFSKALDAQADRILSSNVTLD